MVWTGSVDEGGRRGGCAVDGQCGRAAPAQREEPVMETWFCCVHLPEFAAQSLLRLRGEIRERAVAVVGEFRRWSRYAA